MGQLNRWNIFFRNHRYPCFIADIETNQILYVNDELIKVFHLDESVIGKKFYDAIDGADIKHEDVEPDWEVQKLFEVEFFNRDLNERFQATWTPTKDMCALFCEMRPLEHPETQRSFEEAMSSCMEIYQQPPETTLMSFMELLCSFYNSERAYTYRIDKSDATISCIAQWTKEPAFRVTQEVGERLDARFLINWLETKNKSGIVAADAQEEEFDEASAEGQILKAFKMKNLLLCTVEDGNNDLVGFVGLSNREDSREFFDRRLINTIARFVSYNVTKGTMDETLFQLHYRDSLTGLYNRTGYVKKIDEIMQSKPKSMGIVSANMNGLKYINKMSGHVEGDQHIKNAGKRLEDHFGYEFYRMSGDEFIGLAIDVDKEEFEEKVRELYASMSEAEDYSFSLGHAWGCGKYEVSDLINEADAVVFINKQEYYATNKCNYEKVIDHTLNDLLSYLENGEFMVYLQPQVLLEDGSLYGAEALIRRYDKSNEKMVFPDQFIPLYEQKSIIRHVDLFVVEAVCKLLKEWREEGKKIPISVNLSRVTLLEYGIVDTISKICDEYEVPHELLVVEVTERVGLIENDVATSLIDEFKASGFYISLDDFGCAYSNIVTLSQVEVDEVKIDKSLVDFITTSKKNRILVKNVLAMCNELDETSTLAEGIEDEEQAKLLYELGCRLGQGYYYSRPIPVEEFYDKYMSKSKG